MNIGLKYYKYDSNNNLEVYRVIKDNKDGTFNLKFGKTISTVKKEDLKNDYIILMPDYLMNVFSTTLEIDGNKTRDVYAVVNKVDDFTTNNNEPIVVLRQDVYSLSKNFSVSLDSNVYIGECFIKDKLSGSETMSGMVEFTEINDSAQIYIYIDDIFDDIFNLIPKNFVSKMDEVLSSMNKSLNSKIKGCAKSLKELFIENNFMLNFRTSTNILQLDFPIFITEEKRNEDGSINLNKRQHKRLEDALKKEIKIIKVLEYDKDIDISKIVSVTHVMVADSNDKLYFIAYAKIADYPIDEDITSALGIL